MTAKSFFDEKTEQSLVKATIVAKYFDVWASVIVNTQKIGEYGIRVSHH